MTETFADLFSAAVKRRGLALERLAAHLAAEGVPVSVATLSYWQSGRSVPTRARSQQAVEAMEAILEVPPGTLTEHTSHYLRAHQSTWKASVPSETARQVLAEMGYTRNSLGLHAIATHDRLFLDADGREVQQRSNAVMKVERPLEGWPTVFRLPSDTDVLITLTDPVNCRLGEHVSIPELSLFVGELLFTQPQPAGAVVATGYTVLWEGVRQPSYEMSRGVPKGLRTATMQAQFHPDAVPPAVDAWWRPSFDAPDAESTHLGRVPVIDGLATFASDNLEPGVASLTWTFAPASR